MENQIKELLNDLKAELCEIKKEVASLRIEIERGKAGITAVRAVGVVLLSVFVFFTQHQMGVYEHQNEIQDAQIEQLQKNIK